MYIEVASDYKFMRCGGGNREKRVKFIKKKSMIDIQRERLSGLSVLELDIGTRQRDG